MLLDPRIVVLVEALHITSPLKMLGHTVFTCKVLPYDLAVCFGHADSFELEHFDHYFDHYFLPNYG